ncbi:hypothetical protein B0H16DRAFT_918591 [Mycena metata]|uniref:Uncharacterized protein n=1 Tax=Mycena metata TaxID=1033252 RepID=A0AAD7IR71_9AGAR|nr:hypothetical protein B0H16DRAFT_357107 [Mycena metata]KAJ7747847.1 hypothetical protein B0H16DRAFT_918591 [Mycena metata]
MHPPLDKMRHRPTFQSLFASLMSYILSAGLTAGVLELTLYGAFTVLFSGVMYLFWSRGLISRKQPTFYIFVALVGLFLAVTAHWLNDVYVLYLAFIRLGGGLSAEVLYLTLSGPTYIAHISLVEVAAVITDGLVIHRLYVVASNDIRIIIFPLFLQACQIVCGIKIIFDMSRETVLNFWTLSNPWVTSSLVASIVINGYSTALITFKIWRMSSAIRALTGSNSSGTRLRRGLTIMVESAMLQTTMNILVLVSFEIGSIVQSVFMALQPVVFGISVLLIHVRVGMGWATGPGSNRTTIALNTSSLGRQIDLESDAEGGKATFQLTPIE